MIDFLSNKQHRRWPSGLLGLFLGLNMALTILVLLAPVTLAATTCDGNYPCYTSRACQKAGGSFVACPQKCDSDKASGDGYCYSQWEDKMELAVSIGGLRETIDLGEYIQAAYRYGIGAAAVLAAVMMMIGGLQWLTSRGGEQVGAAKKRIQDATIGLLLTVFAWFILNTINPALVVLTMPRIPMVKKQSFVACDQFKMQKACGHDFALIEKEGAAENAPATERYEAIDDLTDSRIITRCVGGSCTEAGSRDGLNTCIRGESNLGDDAPWEVAFGQPCPNSAEDGDWCSPPDSNDIGYCVPDASNNEVITCISPGGSNTTQSTTCPGCAPGYDCQPCIAFGQECTGVGPNPACCGGYCRVSRGSVESQAQRVALMTMNEFSPELTALLARAAMDSISGICSNGENGQPCAFDAECRGGFCVDVFGSRAGGICMNGSAGAGCIDDADCVNGNCLDSAGKHVCVPKIIGAPCNDDEDCPAGVSCDPLGFGDGTMVCFKEPTTGNPEHRGYCVNDSDCAEQYPDGSAPICVREFEGRHYTNVSFCAAGGPGTLCYGSRSTVCNKFVNSEGQIKSSYGSCYGSAISGDAGICVRGEDGNGCDTEEDNADCRSGPGTLNAVCRPHDETLARWFSGGICSFGTAANDTCIKPSDTSGRGSCAQGLTCLYESQTCQTVEN